MNKPSLIQRIGSVRGWIIRTDRFNLVLCLGLGLLVAVQYIIRLGEGNYASVSC